MEKVTLTPRELVLPEACTLDSSLLDSYMEGIQSFSEKARKSLNIFSNRNGDLIGSNCFAPLVLRRFFPQDTRLATMADLGRATEINSGFLRNFYSDTGLVLRTNGDSYSPNDYLAKDLTLQLRDRGIELKVPIVLYFDALGLRQDESSAYGLTYDLREEAKMDQKMFEAPELTEDFSFSTTNEKGIPIEDIKGNRKVYTRKDGLSGFYLGGCSDVDSNNRNLANSNDDGRVVVVGAEGTAPENLSKYLLKLKEQRDLQIAETDERYAEATRILSGKR